MTDTATPLVLHEYFRSSASYRVRIALNLKGLAYESREVSRFELLLLRSIENQKRGMRAVHLNRGLHDGRVEGQHVPCPGAPAWPQRLAELLSADGRCKRGIKMHIPRNVPCLERCKPSLHRASKMSASVSQPRPTRRGTRASKLRDELCCLLRTF